MNRHLGNTYITINQHLGHPFTSHSPLYRHLGNTYITINRHLGTKITINRHLGYQNNNKSTFFSHFCINSHLIHTYIKNQHFTGIHKDKRSSYI